jgi:hypothetical protein
MDKCKVDVRIFENADGGVIYGRRSRFCGVPPGIAAATA